MSNRCLAGIHKQTGVVEVVACLGEHQDDHLDEIEQSGCYAVVADKDLAKEAWGKKVDSPLDLIED